MNEYNNNVLCNFDKYISKYEMVLMFLEPQMKGFENPIDRLTEIINKHFSILEIQPRLDAIQDIKNLAFLNGIGTERAMQYVSKKMGSIHKSFENVNNNHNIIKPIFNSSNLEFVNCYFSFAENERAFYSAYDRVMYEFIGFSKETSELVRIKNNPHYENVIVSQPAPKIIELPANTPESSKANDMPIAATPTVKQSTKPVKATKKVFNYTHPQIAIAFCVSLKPLNEEIAKQTLAKYSIRESHQKLLNEYNKCLKNKKKLEACPIVRRSATNKWNDLKAAKSLITSLKFEVGLKEISRILDVFEGKYFNP